LEFWFSKQDIDRVSALRGGADAHWVAIAPGAALGRRQWPLENFVRVAKALGERPGLRLMLLGTSAEAAICDALAQACPPGMTVSFAGQLTLAQVAAALATCRLFIGNDSGLLHLACAVGTPVIEISCHPQQAPELHANSPARFGPTVEHSAVLRPPRPLHPACRDGCAFDAAHCIATVDAQAVVRSAASLLATTPVPGPRNQLDTDYAQTNFP
jgi:ADP-heptose:LPS heptosyltransferase